MKDEDLLEQYPIKENDYIFCMLPNINIFEKPDNNVFLSTSNVEDKNSQINDLNNNNTENKIIEKTEDNNEMTDAVDEKLNDNKTKNLDNDDISERNNDDITNNAAINDI